MAYNAPNTIPANSPLQASAIKGNDDALKVYLHEGVDPGDLRQTPWIQTRHIQKPVVDAISSVQHGITGFQGSQWDGGVLARATFGTGFLTGKRYNATLGNIEIIPQTTFTLDLRKQAVVVFHWWIEGNNGPDNGSRTAGNNAYIYITEYNSSGLLAGTGIKGTTSAYMSESVQNYNGWQVNPPGGPAEPYVCQGYNNSGGTKVLNTSGSLTVGLCHVTNIDRCVCLNWGVTIEAYYLR